MRRLDDGGHVLIGAGRLLGDAAHRWALDDDAALTKLVDDRPSMPLLQRLVPAQTPAGAVTRRRESVLRALRRADHDRRESSHAAADEDRLPGISEGRRQI